MTDTSPSPQRPDLEMLWSLRRIIQALDVHSRRLSATADVTLPQLVCLFAVVAEEGMPAREISRRIHVSASTLVGILDRLEGKGLIERTRDTHDRRQIFIVPTPIGRQLIAESPSPFGEAFEQSFHLLKLPEQRRLARCLAQIADLIR